MAAYLNVRARYSKGTLKLKKPLRLPEGAEVSLTVTPLEARAKPRRATKRAYQYPNRVMPWSALDALVGVVSLGGDALADSEALYDGD
jgi:predicted DNA-binding antitoxin AbrB/MazE fold protein